MIGAGSKDRLCPTIGLRLRVVGFRVWCLGFGVWGASRGSKNVTQNNGEEIPENQTQDPLETAVETGFFFISRGVVLTTNSFFFWGGG